ncbi:MAG: hypothetical protein HC828_08535 [Blastochloris sp.]|nr:hypothetical protein [Blastochloris sp.]
MGVVNDQQGDDEGCEDMNVCDMCEHFGRGRQQPDEQYKRAASHQENSMAVIAHGRRALRCEECVSSKRQPHNPTDPHLEAIRLCELWKTRSEICSEMRGKRQIQQCDNDKPGARLCPKWCDHTAVLPENHQ